MTWSEENGESTCETPIGPISIKWWPYGDMFVIEFSGDVLGLEENIEDAKSYAKLYLINKTKQLFDYLIE